MSLQDFFLMHLTSARIFFQDYLYFAVCLHEFFFSDVMAARIFFPAIFLCTNFFWGIFTPPPGISNGPPLTNSNVLEKLPIRETSGVAEEGQPPPPNRHKNQSLKKSKSIEKLGGGGEIHVTFSKLKLTKSPP